MKLDNLKINLKDRYKNVNFYIRILVIITPVLIASLEYYHVQTWQDLGNVLVEIASKPTILIATLLAIYHSFTDTIKKVEAESDVVDTIEKPEVSL